MHAMPCIQTPTPDGFMVITRLLWGGVGWGGVSLCAEHMGCFEFKQECVVDIMMTG
jgi:hypothetical protein